MVYSYKAGPHDDIGLFVILMEGLLRAVLCLVKHIKHININFLISCALDCECKIKIEQKYLAASAFARVFIRAKDAGVAVLHRHR